MLELVLENCINKFEEFFLKSSHYNFGDPEYLFGILELVSLFQVNKEIKEIMIFLFSKIINKVTLDRILTEPKYVYIDLFADKFATRLLKEEKFQIYMGKAITVVLKSILFQLIIGTRIRGFTG